jgi:hypothetical protein
MNKKTLTNFEASDELFGNLIVIELLRAKRSTTLKQELALWRCC